MSATSPPPADGTGARMRSDTLAPWPAQAMLGVLDRDPRALSRGDPLPLGWHWLYFKQPYRSSRLARDGHETRGDFMPDIDLPRRMWAGGALRSLHPVLLGEPAELRSMILDVTGKEGRSGRLAFVTASHTVRQRGRPCVEEEQVIVYREEEPGPAPSSASPGSRPAQARRGRAGPAGGGGAGNRDDAPRRRDHDSRNREGASVPGWTETFLPTTVALFQFSALTYNPHRIHYDHPYVTEREGYRGLLVHGPLTALLLLDAAQRHGPPVTQFRYRALAPLFADEPVTLAGHAASSRPAASGRSRERIVQAHAPSGAVAMRGWAR